MDLLWGGKTVDPVVQNVGGHFGGFFVRDRNNHCNLGEGVGHAEDVLVAAVRFKRSEEICMHDVRAIWNRKWGQWSRLGVTLFSFLTAGASSDVVGDIQFEGWPPPGGFDAVHSAFNGTVSS